MSTIVYQFGLRPPIEGDAAVRQQLRAGHDYKNDLVAIERGRRWAVRQVHEQSEAVREAVAAVRNSTRSTRRATRRALAHARREAERAAPEEMARIRELDAQIRRAARALTTCWWGTYLGVEASADQSRHAAPYDADGVTPAEPQFRRGPRLGAEAFPPDDPRATWWLGDGQVGIHVQGRTLTTRDACACTDGYVRLELLPDRRGRDGYPRHGVLWLRVGSDGRAPIWGKWPVKLHRAIPDQAKWKWVRVSCRREAMYEQWSCEITIDVPEEIAHPRILDRSLDGSIAVAVCWEPLDGEAIRVARWSDSRGESGEVVLPGRLGHALRHGDGIRAVRDIIMGDAREALARELGRARAPMPEWLRQAVGTVALWRSPDRLRALALRWARDGYDGAPKARQILDEWAERDLHLYQYEACERSQALRWRRELYRTTAARWARSYRDVIIDDRDLSREARWGQDSDVRFTAAPAELRASLRNAFGSALEYRWRREEDDDREWPAWAIAEWRRTGRDAQDSSGTAQMRGGAWARRKAKAAERRTMEGGPRKSDEKAAE